MVEPGVSARETSRVEGYARAWAAPGMSALQSPPSSTVEDCDPWLARAILFGDAPPLARSGAGGSSVLVQKDLDISEVMFYLCSPMVGRVVRGHTAECL